MLFLSAKSHGFDLLKISRPQSVQAGASFPFFPSFLSTVIQSSLVNHDSSPLLHLDFCDDLIMTIMVLCCFHVILFSPFLLRCVLPRCCSLHNCSHYIACMTYCYDTACGSGVNYFSRLLPKAAKLKDPKPQNPDTPKP